MTFVLGLTGSIGMGKSTTAKMFAEAGVPVWDADAAVEELYAPNGAAAAEIGKQFPDAVADGKLSRQKLRSLISGDPDTLKRIESIVHPLVAEHRTRFLSASDAPIVLLDIPLLYEVGADRVCDAVVVVSVSEDQQRNRVLARGTMTEQDFELILARQIPDSEKRRRARWVIDTSTLDGARASVADILAEIRQELPDA